MNYFDNDENVKEIDSNVFDDDYPTFLLDDSCTIILFYAPWCPYCKAIKETYSLLGEKLEEKVKVLAFNSENNKEQLQIMKEDSPQLVTAFPTLIMYKDGQPIEKIGNTPEERKLSILVDDAIRLCYQDTM